jgi:hypothetical protein
MTSSEIIQSIQNWEDIRQDSELMIRYFGQGNSYAYSFPSYGSSSDFIHAYPGIYMGELYFFMIPSAYDKEEYSTTIDKYTEPCLLVNTLGSDDRLSPGEAEARIKAWESNYPVWVPAQVNGAYGIFEAFAIPKQDFEVENVVVTLGLKTDATASGGFEADLIVTNGEGKNAVYDDFSKPVPPYSAAPSQEDFYLLSANI